MNRAVRKYCRRVAGMLPCSGKTKKRIMRQVWDNAAMFADSNPGADYQAVVRQFGEPETVAASVLESAGTGEILAAFRIRRRVLTAVVAAIMIGLIIFCGSLLSIYREAQDSIISTIEISPAIETTEPKNP